jgi:acetyl-CoA acyltransferase
MQEAFICDAIRTPFGRYGGSLSSVRTDDLAALALRALMERSPNIDWIALDDVVFGCANQAGEDNRNVARMAVLLAGLPVEVAGTTMNRLCGSSLDAIATATRSIKTGETDLMIAGGVESMSRAPFVMGKADTAFSRHAEIFDTTLGWRFINPVLRAKYGVDSMSETAENVASEFSISRADQDAFAYRSQQRWVAANRQGYFEKELIAVPLAQKKGETKLFVMDEPPRPDTTIEALTKLKPIVSPEGSVTAGNASGINDGAAAVLLASERAVKAYGLTPLARVVGSAVAGVAPRIMGIAPAPATQKLLTRTGLELKDMGIIELNEAFAAQSLAVLRQLGLPDDAEHINPNGGAIAIGHPLGASGARLVTTSVYQLARLQLQYALCTMCIGVGQGIAMILERC